MSNFSRQSSRRNLLTKPVEPTETTAEKIKKVFAVINKLDISTYVMLVILFAMNLSIAITFTAGNLNFMNYYFDHVMLIGSVIAIFVRIARLPRSGKILQPSVMFHFVFAILAIIESMLIYGLKKQIQDAALTGGQEGITTTSNPNQYVKTIKNGKTEIEVISENAKVVTKLQDSPYFKAVYGMAMALSIIYGYILLQALISKFYQRSSGNSVQSKSSESSESSASSTGYKGSSEFN